MGWTWTYIGHCWWECIALDLCSRINLLTVIKECMFSNQSWAKFNFFDGQPSIFLICCPCVGNLLHHPSGGVFWAKCKPSVTWCEFGITAVVSVRVALGFFFCQKWLYLDERVAEEDIHCYLYPDWIVLRTREYAVVATCQSQGNNALLYRLFYSKWDNNLQNAHPVLLKKTLNWQLRP